ncbi:Hsp20/alpha crystallin family protein [Borrelia coriaceae]|uniref:Small heat shock protein n=1 Tax=Borrelia coriaceae ATCC 43381 TaxID=1408429 RepID=W5SZY6_9SPIR|nr:Hsp20/alpha crystallin family protein [Borrelia coriaceae]AHH10621.1 Small heat shock protein [Borrelia coriaceae ATCC 43381]UPA16304.1 Hsp20/alpha crystallin family protein [Borrelia coriaceae]
MLLTNYKRSFLDFLNDDFDLMTPRGIQDVPVNIKDEGKSFTLEAYLPGIKKEDISISVKNDYLTISYESKDETEEQNDKYLRVERKDISFSRSFRLSGNIDQSKIKSELKDGVLFVKLPKKPEVIEKTQEKKIAIE